MKKLVLFVVMAPVLCVAQPNDSLFIRKIFDEVLTNSECYENLRSLCKDVGNRLSGSENADKAVVWGEKLIRDYGFEVRLQEVMVPHWVRGEKETCMIESIGLPLHVMALGGSVGTDGPLTGEVVEVTSFEELEGLADVDVKGKIVFYNVPMEPKHIRTFSAYGGCYPYRSKGASEAAKKGAAATLLRSLSLKLDHHPHTGVMRYEDGIDKVPCAAIGTQDAEVLSAELKKGKPLSATLSMSCKLLPDVKSYNVIGEWKGTIKPDQYIVVGGHLDSWDVGEGAHDDGAGVVHSIEVLRTLRAVGYKPKHTLRVVLFMNEENGARGGDKYAEEARIKGEKHVMAMESDAGGFTPRGFGLNGTPEHLAKLRSWRLLLEPYSLNELNEGFGGVDISPMKEDGVPLIGFVPDSQRYFDFHHAESDVFENIHKRELELGAGSMAALIYLVDKYGL